MSKKYNFYADGGSTGLPAGAEQHYVNHYLNEGASTGVFANGGGVEKLKHFPLDKEKLNEDAKWRADRIKSGSMSTTKKSIEDDIEEYKKDLYLLEIGKKRPSNIIGTGYKGDTKKIAYTWLLEQIYVKNKILELLKDFNNYEIGGSLVDGYLTDPNFGDFQSGVYDNGGQIDTKNVTIAKRIKVKKWYLKTYPKDDLGKEIREDITFWSLWALMSQGYDVYNILGVGDSMIRERVFEELSKILGVDYDVVYQKWLNSDEYADGGEIEFQHSNLRIVGTGIDKNGNRVVKVSFPNQRPFSIQTNGNLPKTHSLLKDYDKKNTNFYKGEIESMEDEILDYIEKYGSENQKKSVRVYGSWLNKDDYAEGGSLGNHGLKQGDQIIKTMSGGVQKVKTRTGDIVYVNLANGYRGAEPPLPFKNGGAVKKNLSRDRKFVNYRQDYEVRYSKDKPKRHGYTKPKMSRTQFEDESFEFFADGGEIRRFNRHEQMDSETREEILDVVSEPNTPRGLVNYLYGLFDGYDYSNTANFKKEMKLLKSKDSKLHDRVIQIYKKIDNYKFEKYGNYATGGGVDNDITYELENFNINNLDKFEIMQYNQFYPSLGKVGALQVLINNVEGDYSQLIEELSELAEKQMSTEEWNESTREMMFERDGYATGGVTKNYIDRNQLNTITIKKGDQKLTYKVSDVYNGAYKLEDGGNLEKMAFYVSKRNVVKVQLKNGKDVKVANGYWIKKGAKPIHTSKYDDGGQLEMKFAGGGKIETKIQKKVDEVNALIEKAVDSDGDPLMVVDTTGTWEEPMQYKPIVYKNGRLYIEYFEPYSGKTEKDVINKSNVDFDGYPTLLNIAKMYRKALKEKGISYAGGGDTKMLDGVMYEKVKFTNGIEDWYLSSDLHRVNFYCQENGLNPKNQKDFEKAYSVVKKYEGGGKTTFKEKATAIAKNFEGKKVEPKYQKEYGKVYDKAEAKEVGNKIAGSQKAKYDSKMSGGGTTKRGGAMVLAKQIRKDGESWASALKRANEQMRKK